MTSGLKIPSSYYLEIINTFPLRPITNEIELIATQNRVNSILDKENLLQEDKDYLKVLGVLIYDYEQKYEQMPILKGVELFKTLLEESNLSPKDLTHIFGSESTILDILDGKQQLTEHQIKELATFFHIAPSYFAKEQD